MCLQYTYQFLVVIHNIVTRLAPKCNDSNSTLKYDASTEGCGHSLHKDLAVAMYPNHYKIAQEVWSNGTQMGVSKNRDTPKWMVYNGNPIKMGDLGVPQFKETPKSPQKPQVFGGVDVDPLSEASANILPSIRCRNLQNPPGGNQEVLKVGWMTVCLLIQLIQPRLDLGISWLNWKILHIICFSCPFLHTNPTVGLCGDFPGNFPEVGEVVKSLAVCVCVCLCGGESCFHAPEFGHAVYRPPK